ncbi:MAG: YfcE family phosphodiesterase [Gemmataceae bacterium]
MIVAVLSDTHGDSLRIATTLELLEAYRPALVIHCGDIDTEAAACQLCTYPMHFVLGNCDPPERVIRPVIEACGGVLHGSFGELVASEKRLAFLHGHDNSVLRQTVHKGLYDYVFFGHTHRASEERVGKTRVINPGALYRTAQPGFVLLDLVADQVKWLALPAAEAPRDWQ